MKIIPVPKKITMGKGTLDLTAINIAVRFGTDERLAKNATTLKYEIEAATGVVSKCGAAFKKPETNCIYIDAADGEEKENLKEALKLGLKAFDGEVSCDEN